MSKIIPIINENNQSVTSNEQKIFSLSIDDSKKVIPIINKDKKQVTLIEPNLPTLSLNNSEDLIPILDDNNDLQLEMNGVGPMGPPGKQGNGILRIEKTGTSNLIDTYTIFFTNGEHFEYQIINGTVYYYNGSYEVTPMPYTEQILPTANLVMTSDVNVKEIPFYEVSNSSGGKTATIGMN